MYGSSLNCKVFVGRDHDILIILICPQYPAQCLAHQMFLLDEWMNDTSALGEWVDNAGVLQ